MITWRRTGIALRIALACLAVALVTIAIIGTGVWLIGGQTFSDLMTALGDDASHAHEMFDESVTRILVMAALVAVAVASLLAVWLGSRLGKPLRDANRAARRVAEGDYAARVSPDGPLELVHLAESFNEMAGALEVHERSQREFIANAAHELRTPLTNLQGYLEALRDGVIQPERAVFESLGEEVDRLVRLSRSLDTLASGATVSARSTGDLDVADAVRTAVDLSLAAAKSKRIDITVELADVRARADPDVMAQILSNLLRNAIDYTPEGGRITVRSKSNTDEVVISVDNTGEGIPATDLPHVFDRFYRVEKSRDRRHGGAGIGLAIVRELVQSAGGRVGAESAPGLTRFWFTMPG